MATVNTLLVIGNGFDLNCGLKSKFNDFLDENGKNSYDIFIDYNEKIPEKYRNIWLFLIYLIKYRKYFENKNYRIHQNDDNWMDIESFIKSAINDNFENTRRTLCENIQIYIDRTRIEKVPENQIEKYIRKYATNEMDAVDFLNKELINFEIAFSEYLKKIVTNAKYLSNAQKILDDLARISDEEISVFSFNYTTIPIDGFKYNHLYNVHGSLADDEQIIIGIDAGDVKASKKATVFSKSFKKLIRKTGFEYNFPDKRYLNNLCFYGHSLGDQDYSYFMAMFNYYNIQNSNVKLYFYYTEYMDGDIENQKILEDYTRGVYALIDRYGQEVFGENQGRNLITKLLLENRILIDKIDKCEK